MRTNEIGLPLVLTRRAGWDGGVAPGLHRVGKTWVEIT